MKTYSTDHTFSLAAVQKLLSTIQSVEKSVLVSFLAKDLRANTGQECVVLATNSRRKIVHASRWSVSWSVEDFCEKVYAEGHCTENNGTVVNFENLYALMHPNSRVQF